MKFTLATKQFTDILDLLGRYVSKHATLPVLEHIYVRGSIDTLIWRATDMEKYIEIEAPATLDTDGAITINAKMLTELVRSVDDDHISVLVEQSRDMITLDTSSDKFTIKGIPASEYVSLPEVPQEQIITLDVNYLIKGISKVEFAVQEKAIMPLFGGVVIKGKKTDAGDFLVFVGTDSMRLADYKIQLSQQITSEFTMIIPKAHVNDIKRVLEFASTNNVHDVKVIISKNLVSFEYAVEGVKVKTCCLLIQGNFPDHENEQITPTTYDTLWTINKTALEKSMRKVSLLTRDINNYILLSSNHDVLSVTSGETDKGEGSSDISVALQGSDMQIGVNSKQIQDVLKVIESPDLQIRLISSSRPLVLIDKDDPGFRYIVRPLNK